MFEWEYQTIFKAFMMRELMGVTELCFQPLQSVTLLNGSTELFLQPFTLRDVFEWEYQTVIVYSLYD